MSRSYKKNMGDTWACGSDKYSRNMYQRSFRKKSKDIWDRYNDAFSDKWLISLWKKINYGK